MDFDKKEEIVDNLETARALREETQCDLVGFKTLIDLDFQTLKIYFEVRYSELVVKSLYFVY